MATITKFHSVHQLLDQVDEKSIRIVDVVDGRELRRGELFSLTSPGKHEMKIFWEILDIKQ